MPRHVDQESEANARRHLTIAPQKKDLAVFCSIFESDQIVKSKEDGLISEKFLNKIGEINEEDNPAILKYKIAY
jgi:hypothetical protein